MSEHDYWVYMLLCHNNTYYTGYTNNLSKRYHTHLTGTGKCKYTRSFKPISMVQAWKITGDKALAMHIERKIKKLPRDAKEKIIRNPSSLCVSDAKITPIDSDTLHAISSCTFSLI